MYTVYSKDVCPQCNQALLILDMKGETYEVKKLGIDFTKDDLLIISPNAKSFPVILKDGALVGGLLELKQSLK